MVAGNRDDHLRNHGFLRAPEGWRLAPAFDMNPARAAHPHGLSLDGRGDAQDILTALATHRLYALSERDAKRILAEVMEAVSPWEDEAERSGIGAAERQVVAPAFAALADAERLARP